MKPIRGLKTAPPGLSEFVGMFPNEREWEAFKSFCIENTTPGSAFKELLHSLIKMQHGLCCYCEIRLVELDWQVEHFQPKRNRDISKSYTFDHENMLAACCGGINRRIWGEENKNTAKVDVTRYREPQVQNLSCGQSKDRHESASFTTAVIDPRTLPSAVKVIRVSMRGDLEPDLAGCAATNFEPELVSKTIEILGLNCPRLRTTREDRLNQLQEAYNDMDAESLEAAARYELLPNADGYLPDFFTTARHFFREAAENLLNDAQQLWI